MPARAGGAVTEDRARRGGRVRGDRVAGGAGDEAGAVLRGDVVRLGGIGGRAGVAEGASVARAGDAPAGGGCGEAVGADAGLAVGRSCRDRELAGGRARSVVDASSRRQKRPAASRRRESGTAGARRVDLGGGAGARGRLVADAVGEEVAVAVARAAGDGRVVAAAQRDGAPGAREGVAGAVAVVERSFVTLDDAAGCVDSRAGVGAVVERDADRERRVVAAGDRSGDAARRGGVGRDGEARCARRQAGAVDRGDVVRLGRIAWRAAVAVGAGVARAGDAPARGRGREAVGGDSGLRVTRRCGHLELAAARGGAVVDGVAGDRRIGRASRS